jgi:spore maturation protein CgeB
LRLFCEDETSYFRNPQELSEKISFYLENPSKREEIAKRAYIRVIKEHTFLHRMKEILSILGKR